MTSAFPEVPGGPLPNVSPDIQIEVTDTPLPLGMRLACLRSNGRRRARPRLPSLPSTFPSVPVVGVTALTMLLVRDRRRATH